MKSKWIPPEQLLKLPGAFYMFVVFFISTTSFFAQNSVVIGLRYNGQNVDTANTTHILPDNGGTKAQINKGDHLISGTHLIIPNGTTVILQSPGGKQICSSTKGNTMEYTVQFNSKGENHTVKGAGAQIKSTVSKAVSYNYQVNNGRGTTSAARGTEFTYTGMSEGSHEQALITTEEGSIPIIDKLPVSIAGTMSISNKRNEPLTQAISSVQHQGDQMFTSSDQPLLYESYLQAIQQVSERIYAMEKESDKVLAMAYQSIEDYDKNHCKNELDLAVNRAVEKLITINMLAFNFAAVPAPYRTFNFIEISKNENFINMIISNLDKSPGV